MPAEAEQAEIMAERAEILVSGRRSTRAATSARTTVFIKQSSKTEIFKFENMWAPVRRSVRAMPLYADSWQERMQKRENRTMPQTRKNALSFGIGRMALHSGLKFLQAR